MQKLIIKVNDAFFIIALTYFLGLLSGILLILLGGVI